MFSSEILTGQSEKHLVEFHGSLVNWAIVCDLQSLTIAAKQAGFDLAIASSFRNFDRQLMIWQKKYTGINPVFDIHDEPVEFNGLSDLEKCQAIMLFWPYLVQVDITGEPILTFMTKQLSLINIKYVYSKTNILRVVDLVL